VPHENLPGRSTTSLRKKNTIPYRIDLAGGWLDQPYVSKHYPGPVITVSIEPDHVFNERSGMSTSTRKKAMELWENKIPAGDKIKLAKILFCYENPPGSKYISGSQDSLGIVLPGINYLWYDKQQYWPSKIKNIIDAGTIKWLEQRLFLLPLPPRHNDLVVTDNSIINKKNAKALSTAADDLWNALLLKDDTAFGNAMTDSFNAQISLFPNMINADVRKAIDNLPDTVLGYKLSGAGGGGYLVLFMNEKLENTITVRVRR
jgi:galactokinase/mevalonate kinase-like predicted kinase